MRHFPTPEGGAVPKASPPPSSSPPSDDCSRSRGSSDSAAVLVAAVGRLLAQQGIVGQRLQAAALEHRPHAPVPADAVASDLLDLGAYNRRDAVVVGGGCVVV
jgi:hypothetical protein